MNRRTGPLFIRLLAIAALVMGLIVLSSGSLSAAAASAQGQSTGAPHGRANSADYDPAAAQDYVSGYAKRNGIPGVAYAVVKNGRTVASDATGDISDETPVSVGSISKSFTAFAVLQLVDAGKVNLDYAVTDYLPDFNIHGTEPSRITVRMLLDHTSGIPNPALVPSTGSLAGAVANIAERKVVARPGTGYRYSNLNYWTLALLVQRVSGQEFTSYLHDHIFRPLGMRDTTSVINVGNEPGLSSGSVTAYGSSIGLPEMHRTIGGAGGVISTAKDMTAWLAMQQRGGVSAEGKRLLSARLVAKSHKAQSHAGTYGLGWQHTSTARPERIGHDGANTRYSARQDLVPSTGYATVVLLDSYTPTISHPFEISTGLIDLGTQQKPRIGLPKATLMDLALATATFLVALLTVVAIRRAPRWARRHADRPGWRSLLRLLPHAITPVIAVVLFLGLTLGPGNPATPLDVFGLWPAAMILVAGAAASGICVITARVIAVRRAHDQTCPRR